MDVILILISHLLRVSIFAAISLDLYDSSLDASLSGIWKLEGLKKFPRNLLKCN